MPTLTIVGAPTFNGDGTTTIGSAGDRLDVPTSGLDPSSGYIAARVKPGWASSAPPTNPRVADVFAGGLLIYFNPTAGGGGVPAWVVDDGTHNQTQADTFSANTGRTVIGQWDSLRIYIAQNGSSFTSVAGATLSLTGTASIGNNSGLARFFNGAFVWMIFGRTVLSDADSTSLNALGDTDPAWGSYPGMTMLWTASDSSYLIAGPNPNQRIPLRTISRSGAY